MVQSGQDSLLPLFLINPPEKGGFDFDQTDIGWLYTGIGPIQIVFNHILIFLLLLSFTLPLIFPLVAKLLSYTEIYSWTGILYSVMLFIYPVISLFNTTPIWVVFPPGIHCRCDGSSFFSPPCSAS